MNQLRTLIASATLLLLSGGIALPVHAEVCCSCTNETQNGSICLTASESVLPDANNCSTLPQNGKLDATWSCTAAPLSSTTCKRISDGGTCAYGPMSVSAITGMSNLLQVLGDRNAYAKELGSLIGAGIQGAGDKLNKAPTPDPINISLNVPIPGFEPPKTVENFLGSYIVGAYRYAISIVAIVATVMFIAGAFTYLLSAGGVGKINTGKALMTDSIIGMLLVIGATAILNTINPELTKFNALDITTISTIDAFTDIEKERARVQSSARVSKGVEVPVVNLDTGLIQQTPTVGSSQQVVGTDGLARDPVGNLIAQGGCPADMVPIPKSDSYQKSISSFCIDRFEAPNRRGEKPYRGITEFEAEWFCDSIGKRLCTTDEWQRACLGPDGKNTYGYGPQYIQGSNESTAKSQATWGSTRATGKPPAPCNYDTLAKGTYNDAKLKAYPVYKDKETSILNPNNPKLSDPKLRAKFDLMITEVNRLDGSEPSGAREGCVTAEGVYDMSGNMQEITLKPQHLSKTVDERIELMYAQMLTCGATGCSKPKLHDWSGFFWTPTWHQGGWNSKPTCTAVSGGTHGEGWRSYENGFRCCMNLSN